MGVFLKRNENGRVCTGQTHSHAQAVDVRMHSTSFYGDRQLYDSLTLSALLVSQSVYKLGFPR